MNRQRDLFDKLRPDPYGGRAPSVNTDTSRDAAASIQAVLGPLQLRVLRYIASCGKTGTTCDAAEAALSMRHQTCSARIRELALKDRIVDSGERRRTRSGRTAIVYVLPEHHPEIV